MTYKNVSISILVFVLLCSREAVGAVEEASNGGAGDAQTDVALDESQSTDASEEAASAENAVAGNDKTMISHSGEDSADATEMVASDENKPVVSGCAPTCRSGFVCYKGMCVSACNPPCASGFICDEQAQCAPTVGSDAVPGEQMTLREARDKRRNEIRQERHARRMAYRPVTRLMISSQLGLVWLGKDPDNAFLTRWGLGIRKQLVDKFGIWAKAELLLGFQNNLYGEDDSIEPSQEPAIGLSGFGVELGGYLGPLKRFYLGPVFGLEGTFPMEDSVEVEFLDGTIEDLSYDRRITATYGLAMGILAGRKENINIHWRFSSAFDFWQMPISFMFGLSFDLPLRKVD